MAARETGKDPMEESMSIERALVIVILGAFAIYVVTRLI